MRTRGLTHLAWQLTLATSLLAALATLLLLALGNWPAALLAALAALALLVAANYARRLTNLPE